MTEHPVLPAEEPTSPAAPTSGRLGLLLVTGMSGAGKTTALKALEDMGYEAVDNLPLALLSGLIVPHSGTQRPLAIGVDIRTRDFGVEHLLAVLETLRAQPDLEVSLVFLDCDDEVLRRRYTETRRRHPLAADRQVMDGIQIERRFFLPLKGRADLVIDSTDLALNDLRQLLGGHFALSVRNSFAISVLSFSYRNGIPREADLVFDVRFLANPHYDPDLRQLTGLDAAVAEFVASDDGFNGFFDSLTALLGPLLPRFREEGKSYLTIAIGCTGGQHRSVFIADRLAAWLTELGEQVSVRHRELPEGAGA